MKKVMKKVITILCICLLLTGCGEASENNEGNNQQKESKQKKSEFVTIENGWDYKVVYQRDTKVMYVVSWGSYNIGTFTLLVNADGTPMVYEESEGEE
jgi:ABC-type enterochelin transport system substrate-binding protein